MLRLYRLQIDVLLKELLVLGELCSPTVLRLYEQKKEEILEVVRKIAPFLTALLDSHPQHLEALEAARRFNAMQENLVEMRRFQSRLLEARVQPKNWDTYVLPSSVARE